jgi:DNA polymerase-1
MGASLAQALAASKAVGLDLETTGLDPRQDRICVVTLAPDAGGVWVLDTLDSAGAEIDLGRLWPALASKVVVAHNAAFDLAFLMRRGFTPGRVVDTLILSQLLYAGLEGYSHSLAACVARELGEELDKAEQVSDWTRRPLTPEQVQYARRDAAVLLPLMEALDKKIREARIRRPVEIELQALPAVVSMQLAGVPFDLPAWQELEVETLEKAAAAADQLRAITPPRPPKVLKTKIKPQEWNWNSSQQVREILAGFGINVESTCDEVLATIRHPFATGLREYRKHSKRGSTFGSAWPKTLDKAAGRLYPGWRQLGAAATGRMSCADPNLQQVPHEKAYRACFRAPEGRVLIKADYSQIELRIAAKVAPEPAMVDYYCSSPDADLHKLTASRLLGKELAEVSKADRQIAKSANFGLLYGMGAAGYQVYALKTYGLELTLEEAFAYRELFFDAYPGLVDWHKRTGRLVQQKGAVETRTLTGRRRLEVDSFNEAVNTPVQGTGADGVKLALALLWHTREEIPSARVIMVVHDEIVLECDQADAERAAEWLRRCMVDAMAPLIAPVPVMVEVNTGRAWGGD